MAAVDRHTSLLTRLEEAERAEVLRMPRERRFCGQVLPGSATERSRKVFTPTLDLYSAGLKVVDHGDVVPDEVAVDDPANNVARPRNVGTANKKLSDMVEKIVRQNQTCLLLGGDHSVAIGSISGHKRAAPDLVVVWIDAHADINTPLTTPSGNIHGMPLSFLVKELEPHMTKLPGFEWVKPCISAKDLVYIGLRDVDPGEKAIIDKLGIHSYSMQEIDKSGIGEVLTKALNAVDPVGNRPIHVSFDVDSMDPDFIPSTGTPVPGGLTLRETSYIAEELAATGRMGVIDCVEVNPLLGSKEDQQKTVDNTLKVMGRFFGTKRIGNASASFEFPTA